ncbi:MAG: TetR family transcriptional regulator [Clostridiales bacterium]|nr:TetR family transcriptional regulator [Clostridiales bacterium]
MKELTVKDIVEECHITRQTFYYHFEDIPAMFCWVLQRDTERLIQRSIELQDGEQKLKFFFQVAL